MDNNVFFRLKNERLRLGLGQSDVANATDVSLKTVQRWEKEIAIPSDKLALLVNLGVDAQYIVTGRRSSNSLSLDDVFLLEKIRQAGLETRNKILMLLLGGKEISTNGVVNQNNVVHGQQAGSNNEQVNNFGTTTQNSAVKVKKMRKGTVVGIKNN